MHNYDYELIPPDSAEHAELVVKCQENWWLQKGSIPWQDGPYLEEYPYEFVCTDDLDALQAYFQRGNYTVKQGIFYKDTLVFIQQESGGDEWWTLKRNSHENGKWVAFESWSFGPVEWYDRKFSSIIASMELATIEQCKGLTYGISENDDLLWSVGEPGACPWEGASADTCWCYARGKEYELSIYGQEDNSGYRADVLSAIDQRLLYSQEDLANPIAAANEAVNWVKDYRKNGESELFRMRSQESSIARAAALRENARAFAESKENEAVGRVR